MKSVYCLSGLGIVLVGSKLTGCYSNHFSLALKHFLINLRLVPGDSKTRPSGLNSWNRISFTSPIFMNKKCFNERSKRFSFGQKPVKAKPKERTDEDRKNSIARKYFFKLIQLFKDWFLFFLYDPLTTSLHALKKSIIHVAIKQIKYPLNVFLRHFMPHRVFSMVSCNFRPAYSKSL